MLSDKANDVRTETLFVVNRRKYLFKHRDYRITRVVFVIKGETQEAKIER